MHRVSCVEFLPNERQIFCSCSVSQFLSCALLPLLSPSSTLYTLNHSQGLFRIGEWSGAQLSFRSQPGNPHPPVTLPDCLLFPFFRVSLFTHGSLSHSSFSLPLSSLFLSPTFYHVLSTVKIHILCIKKSYSIYFHTFTEFNFFLFSFNSSHSSSTCLCVSVCFNYCLNGKHTALLQHVYSSIV